MQYPVMKDGYKNVGERVAALREAAGINQRQFAIELGIRQQSLSEIESGKSKSPSATTLLKAAGRLNVNPWYLLTGEGVAREKDLRPDVFECASAMQELTRDQVTNIKALIQSIVPAANKGK